MQTPALTIKGQVTVPVNVRRSLGLKPGDRIQFREEQGRFFIEPERAKVSDLFGIVKAKKPATLAQMDEAVAAGWAKRARR